MTSIGRSFLAATTFALGLSVAGCETTNQPPDPRSETIRGIQFCRGYASVLEFNALMRESGSFNEDHAFLVDLTALTVHPYCTAESPGNVTVVLLASFGQALIVQYVAEGKMEMPRNISTVAIPVALELLNFLISRGELQGKTAEELMEEWAATNTRVHAALERWRSAQPPQPSPNVPTAEN